MIQEVVAASGGRGHWRQEIGVGLQPIGAASLQRLCRKPLAATGLGGRYGFGALSCWLLLQATIFYIIYLGASRGLWRGSVGGPVTREEAAVGRQLLLVRVPVARGRRELGGKLYFVLFVVRLGGR